MSCCKDCADTEEKLRKIARKTGRSYVKYIIDGKCKYARTGSFYKLMAQGKIPEGTKITSLV